MRIDDLNVGDIVLVFEPEPEAVDTDLPPWMRRRHQRNEYPGLAGLPLRILAIALPHLMVQVSPDGATFSIDSRHLRFTKCGRTYRRVHDDMIREMDREENKRKGRGAPDPDAARDRNLCPRCGARMRETKKANGPWQLACPECRAVVS